ncbi:MAG: succinyl-diaminopimelate desuccinylase [Desulfurococcales archaeon ex4484_217_2]|nr:MAG: succinyl-diaminopimelate desuccinylase [Desulfurococcales archaeon ex4484_217_2]
MEKVLKKVDELHEYYVNLLKDMVSIATVVPPGENYKEFVEYGKEVLKDLGMEVSVVEVPKDYLAKHIPEMKDNPRYILLGRLKGDGKTTLHFNGHYDVVPPGAGWRTDPFKPVIVNGKLYGRGASDMKGGIVSILTAIKALVESGIEISGTLEVSMTPDEEIGGMCGANYMLEAELTKPDYCIIAEPSGYDRVWIGHKGSLWGEIVVYGKTAHASTPWLGVNAFEKMVKLANKLIEQLKPKVESKVTKYETDAPEGKRATIVLGSIVKGGVKINVVPDKVIFQFDRRVLPEEDFENVIKEVEEVIEEAKKEDPELKAEFKVLFEAKPAAISPQSKLALAMKEAVREVIGREPRLTLSTGFLDARFFVEKGIETLTYGPGDLSQAHVANEYIELSKIPLVSKAYILSIMKLLK